MKRAVQEAALPFRWPTRGKVLRHAKWFSLAVLTFIGTYGPINIFNDSRSDLYHLWFTFELGIEAVPWMTYVYFSMYFQLLLPLFILEENEIIGMCKAMILANFIAGGCFLLVPTELGWPRQPAGDHFLFQAIHALDLPHNLMPSLHIAYGALVLLSLWKRLNRALALAFVIWFFAICASVVLVRQHHVIDIPTGFLLALACMFAVRRLEKNASRN